MALTELATDLSTITLYQFGFLLFAGGLFGFIGMPVAMAIDATEKEPGPVRPHHIFIGVCVLIFSGIIVMMAGA